MVKAKTPDYTKKAIKKYIDKFDRIAVNLEKGSAQWIRDNTGKSCNQFFVDLFNEYKKNSEKETEGKENG